MTTPTEDKPARRVRAACNACHAAKMKCSGERPCAACVHSGRDCVYNYASKMGRPKGVKNKKTQRERDGNAGPNSDTNSTSNVGRSGTTNQFTVPPQSLPYNGIPENAASDLRSIGYDAQVQPTMNGEQILWDLSTPMQGVSMPGSMMGMTANELDPSQPFLPEMDSARFDTAYEAMSIDLPQQSRFRQDVIDQFTQQPLGMDSLPSTIFTTQSVSSMAFPSDGCCPCVQAHAQFFCRLKDEYRTVDSLTVSNNLEAAKQILGFFNKITTCSMCREDEENAAQILLVLCIRTVLKRFRALLQPQSSLSADRSRYDAMSTSGMSTGDQLVGLQMDRRCSARTVQVDNLKLSQDEQTYLVHMLVVRTVAEMRLALRSLKSAGIERDGRKHSIGSEFGSDELYSSEESLWASQDDWRSESESGKAARDDQFLCSAIESLCDGLSELERSLENVASKL